MVHSPAIMGSLTGQLAKALPIASRTAGMAFKALEGGLIPKTNIPTVAGLVWTQPLAQPHTGRIECYWGVLTMDMMEGLDGA
jgi:hypothetical protein